jgi:23S rRNA (adenine-N6)-dimethyltransferase
VGERPRSPRGSSRASGQHLLRSDRLADELVRHAGIAPGAQVLEVGAGAGRLTEPLARRGASVIAVELDPRFADQLRRRFARDAHVDVVQDDILQVPFPSGRFRVFGNIPFGITTPILRRLVEEPASPMERADLVVQLEAARKRASVWPTTLLSLGWLPWWEFTVVRRIPARAFEPPPRVDAALLVVTRRVSPLLGAEERPAYVALLRRAFEHGSWPVRRSLHREMTGTTWRRLVRERGLASDATPPQLDVFDWIDVFQSASRHLRTTPFRRSS